MILPLNRDIRDASPQPRCRENYENGINASQFALVSTGRRRASFYTNRHTTGGGRGGGEGGEGEGGGGEGGRGEGEGRGGGRGGGQGRRSG